MNIINKIDHFIVNFPLNEFSIGFATSMSMCIGSLLAHEYSHMIAMRVLFKNIDPYISCSGLECAVYYNGTPIIRPELSITPETGYGLVSAAGPISDITHIALSSMIAWYLRHSDKKVRLVFATHAFLVAFNDFEYCLSTLGSKNWKYDFVSIQDNLGISHNIQLAIITSVTLCAAAMLLKHSFFSEESKKEAEKIYLVEKNKDTELQNQDI